MSTRAARIAPAAIDAAPKKRQKADQGRAVRLNPDGGDCTKTCGSAAASRVKLRRKLKSHSPDQTLISDALSLSLVGAKAHSIATGSH
jgi:hypothetical protein